eukprot:gene10711-12413_t
MRELKVLGALDHQNIVKKLRGFRTPQGHIYLVMEYVEKSLSEMLKAGKVFDADELKLVMWELLDATTYMHKKGIMHRDLKPSNVLINSEGSVKICDLGFARGVESISQPADYTPYITTRWYRAPEVLLGGPYSPNVDVWSLGCIFAELVTGSVLLCGSSSLDQLQAVHEVVGHLSPSSRCAWMLDYTLKGQSVGISHIIKSCLEPDPIHRPSTAQLLNSIFFMDIAAVKLRVKAKQSAANAGPPSCVSAPEQDNHGSGEDGSSSRADVTSSHTPAHACPAQAVSAEPLVNTALTQGPMTSAAQACPAPNITDSASSNCKAQVQPARITADPGTSDIAQASRPAVSKPSSSLYASLHHRVPEAGPLSQLPGLGGAPPAKERNLSPEAMETNRPGSSSVSSRFEVMEGQEPSALMCWAGQDFNMAIVRPDGPAARKTIEMEAGASSSSKQFSRNTSSVNLGVALDRIQDSVSTVLQVPQPQCVTPNSGGVSRPDGLPTLKSKPGIISPNPSPHTSTLAVPLGNPQQAMPSGCFSFASLMGSLGFTAKKVD